MTWKTVDFQAVLSLDTPLIEDIQHFLAEKEAHTCSKLIAALEPLYKSSSQHDEQSPPRTLTAALDWISKGLLKAKLNHPSFILKEQWTEATKQCDEILNEYANTLEGCALELFTQLEEITLAKWHTRLVTVIGSIKQNLLHRMEELIWAIKRLEDLLKKSEERVQPQESGLKRFFAPWHQPINPIVIGKLEVAQEQLRAHYYHFLKRYESYLNLLEKADKAIGQMGSFPIFTSLERDQQEHFLKLMQILKLIEINRKDGMLTEDELLIALHTETYPEKASHLFKEYALALRAALFTKSIEGKLSSLLPRPVVHGGRGLEEIATFQKELELLHQDLKLYNAILETSLASSEEHIQWKQTLAQVDKELTELSEQYGIMLRSLKDPTLLEIDLPKLCKEIEEYIEEMGVPLANRQMMRHAAEEALTRIDKINEIGSKDPNVIPLIEELLAKLLRADWRYHLLHGISLFHRIYCTHQGFARRCTDRQQEIRTGKFILLLDRIDSELKNRTSIYDFHTIETLENDLKGSLQDLLGSIQRALIAVEGDGIKQKILTEEYHHLLIEYRYHFGKFLYPLYLNNQHASLIRREFLFVDQYLDSMEFRIQAAMSASKQKDER